MTENKISQEQIYNLLVSRELSWHSIILDLINTEQLDPWDIDLTILAQRYIEKIRKMEEASFYISSKVLLAAAILLRIKSEMLIDRFIKSLDEILFGKEEKEKPSFEFDMDGVSELLPKTPLPRMRKVTLQELMSALNKAMITEQRRIKKEVAIRHATKLMMMYVPRKTMNIREKIKEVYEKILAYFQKNSHEKIKFSSLAGETRESKVSTFVPLLYLYHQEKVELEQERPFEEIFISLFKPTTIEDVQGEIKEEQKKHERADKEIQGNKINEEKTPRKSLSAENKYINNVSAQDLIDGSNKK